MLFRDRTYAGKQRIQRMMIVRKETLKLQFCQTQFEGDAFWCVANPFELSPCRVMASVLRKRGKKSRLKIEDTDGRHRPVPATFTRIERERR